MIYLTGDVHSRIKGNWEQEKAGSEFRAAEKYLKILAKKKISCTLFLNGSSLDNDYDKVSGLLRYDVELGGHTYDNFGKMNLIKSYLNRRKWKCVYGPESFQRKDVKKTKRAFERRGLEMKSWRTHAFASNDKTFKILEGEGVKYVSDLFEQKPFKKEGIIHMPINIPVDGNTISYGPLNPRNRDPFAGCTKSRISADEWLHILKERVKNNERKGIDSVILIHPITMAVLDNFKTFEKVASFISRYKSKKISEHKIK